MVNRRYNVRRTISMKHFISDFGENFSDHMKQKLMEIEVRCVLARQKYNKLQIRHVEHTKYEFSGEDGAVSMKEYAYGELLVVDNILYFCQTINENANIMKSPIVDAIYDSLSGEGMVTDDGVNCKRIDDSNIDFLIDTMLTVFPQVSQSYIDIISRY